jgi:hypothetical protein
MSRGGGKVGEAGRGTTSLPSVLPLSFHCLHANSGPIILGINYFNDFVILLPVYALASSSNCVYYWQISILMHSFHQGNVPTRRLSSLPLPIR